MITLVASALLLALAQAPSPAVEGDAAAGKELWQGRAGLATMCRFCHGDEGEGGFGPVLAGRDLTFARFQRAVRQPAGIMPAFVDSQVSDKEIADFIAYFDSLPKVEQPGKWRYEVPADAPRGQRVALATVGCAQCHAPTLDRMRQGMGAVDPDFAWFRNMVYNHGTAISQHWQSLGEKPNIRVLMGSYSPAQVPESLLQEVFTFARDLGLRPLVLGHFSPGVRAATGVTYTLNIENLGLPGKGLAAEDVAIAVRLPAGAEVVSAQGMGFRGVRPDAELKGDAAVWHVGRIGPQEHHTFTITLSKAGTASDNVSGVVRWTKPAVKLGPMDSISIPAPPLALQ